MALTNAQKLEEAETAYHDLVTGAKARVVVDQNGERVEFTPANRAALAQYIEKLKELVTGVQRVTGPLKVWLK